MAHTISKKEVVTLLEEIGTLLELQGENPFKSRAYYQAARSLESVDEDLAVLIDEGRLSEVKGIGAALNKKITELVTTGSLDYYEKLKAHTPLGLFDMLKIQGLGPKKIRTLYDMLHIETIGELEYACIENRLVDLPGFGKKTQGKILTGIEHLKLYSERHLYAEIIETARSLLDVVRNHRDVAAAELGGSIRRCNEVVKDIDILAATERPAEVAMFFSSLPDVADIIAKGQTKVSVRLHAGINVDLRIVTTEQFPYALHHFTGSKEHNTAMRARAKTMGLKMNEYGIFSPSEMVTCGTEEDIFTALGLSYIPPELRENMGEIEAAEKDTLPRLVESSDIQGLFHIHTNESDGADSLESLVRAAKDMGLRYIGISDHSETAFYAGGLLPEAIRKQHALIDTINKRDPALHIFKGIEAEILPDGSLDYNNTILQLFDFVIAAVHSHFTMSETEMTRRIMRALDNPFTTMLAHPTGRLLLAREPYDVDITKIIDHAARTHVCIELNAHPRRLDLDWRYCKYAREKGVTIAINPDAHSIDGLHDVRYGINIARKGWLETVDCINCRSLEEIKKLLSPPK